MPSRFLLLFNLAQCISLAAMGAVLIDDAIYTGYEISDDDDGSIYYPFRTAASRFADFFGTIAGVVGVAAALPGLQHVRVWSQGSLPAAAYSGFMAWLLTLLALGLAIKEIILGTSVHEYKLGSTSIFLGGKWYLIYSVPKAVILGCLSATQLCYLRIIFHTGT